MEYKRCFKCGRLLPLSGFYKHPMMKDGHLNKCKECTKKDVHKNYEVNVQSEEYLEKERKRGREKYKRLNYKDRYKPKQKFFLTETFIRKLKQEGIMLKRKNCIIGITNILLKCLF